MYEIKREKPRTFDFKVGKKTYSVPLTQYLPWSVVKEYQEVISDAPSKERNTTALNFMVALFNEYTENVLDTLTVGEINDLMNAYQAESAVSMGESQQS